MLVVKLFDTVKSELKGSNYISIYQGAIIFHKICL
jgi:hypothetical protein